MKCFSFLLIEKLGRIFAYWERPDGHRSKLKSGNFPQKTENRKHWIQPHSTTSRDPRFLVVLSYFLGFRAVSRCPQQVWSCAPLDYFTRVFPCIKRRLLRSKIWWFCIPTFLGLRKYKWFWPQEAAQTRFSLRSAREDAMGHEWIW